MNQAFHLYRLQQIDTQIDQAESSIAEVDRIMAEDATMREAQSTADEASKALHQAQQALKQAEFAVHEQQMKIGQSEASLYSGRIHNPKELQDIQKEIASLKKHLAVLEDQQLELMMALEEAEARDTAARENQARVTAAFVENSAGWTGKKEQNLRSLERLQAERGAAKSLVSPQSLRVYDALRKKKNGIAVTLPKDGSCTVCGGEIRPSEVQAARAAPNFVYCESCGRIIYAG